MYFLEILVILLVLINFLLLRKLSNNRISEQKIYDLEKNVESINNELSKLEKYSKNIHFHHNQLSSSIIKHLHASGTIYSTRIWDTYEAEIEEEWELEKADNEKWPDYFPIIENNYLDNISMEDYRYWVELGQKRHYLNHPNERVDSNYIVDMKW